MTTLLVTADDAAPRPSGHPRAPAGAAPAKHVIRASARLLELAAAEAADVYARLATRAEGLGADEARTRLAEHGPNRLATERQTRLAKLLWHAAINPLVILLATLATVSFATGDPRAGTLMGAMILLSIGLELIQEVRAGNSAAKLKAMIAVRATVHRDGAAREVAVAELVPGDVIELAAGDMIPADIRILQSKDLFVNQSSLTGESFPVEKHATQTAGPADLEHPTLAFLGTSVESGSALAVVVETGPHTYLGTMAASIEEAPPPTAFDRDISRFTWLMLRFMAVMVPLVFVINVITKGSWSQAFFFAVAVAVGLTPEMLPMIVTVCLSKGAVAMSKKKVIVKHLNSIQNLGAMDILCTDKTGTLTQDRVVLERYCDVALRDDEAVLALAYTNSHFQTGLRNVLDRAVLAHEETHVRARIPEYAKVDEIPFDFERRIMSVVVRTPEGKDRMISKGAPEAIFPRCAGFELAGERLPMDHEHVAKLEKEYNRLSADGFRVLAIATKDLAPRAPYGKADEQALILRGYLAFFDPPKESCGVAITELEHHGIAIKVITGDNDLVARKVCSEVGIATDVVLLGPDVERMSDEELARAVEPATLFARVSPAHKQRIVRALQANGHTVGFMGDGINDAPALHTADVGISVDTAVDIAKASADLILLEKSLRVLDEGVLEGRKVFANISKYVRMGASSNFGNMFSVLGASIFVPFLPMLPIQILTNNLLYDLGQTTIPTDAVDTEQIQRPRPWNMRALTRFIALIGPCSSLFDYTTFFVMLYGFHAWHDASLFQTGWFVESILTQTLIIHVIRTNKLPFVQSRASWPVMAMSVVVSAAAVLLPISPIGRYLGFVPLPARYWPVLVATLLCYFVVTQRVKTWLLRRGWL